MDQELARKRSATIVTGMTAVYPHLETLTAPLHGKAELLREIRAMSRRGEIGRTMQIRQTSRGWAITVTVLRAPRGWWRRNGLRLSLAVAVLAGSLAALAWAVSVLVAAVAAALPLLGGFLLVLAIACALVAVSSGGRVVEVIQKVKIKG